MAFTPETGTGLATANAYITLAAFKAHHNDRGRVYTGLYTDPVIQTAIVKATDYLDKRFGRRFRGVKGSSAQALAWPRISAFDASGYAFEGVPRQLAMATAEYAWVALGLGTTELAPTVEGSVEEKTETVGPISTSLRYSTRFSDNSLVTGIMEYPEADLWVLELLESTQSREVSL